MFSVFWVIFYLFHWITISVQSSKLKTEAGKLNKTSDEFRMLFVQHTFYIIDSNSCIIFCSSNLTTVILLPLNVLVPSNLQNVFDKHLIWVPSSCSPSLEWLNNSKLVNFANCDAQNSQQLEGCFCFCCKWMLTAALAIPCFMLPPKLQIEFGAHICFSHSQK